MAYTKSETIRYRIDRFTANRYLDSQQDDFAIKTFNAGRTKTGEYLPKWRKVISAGGNATTPFSGTINSVQADYVNMAASVYWTSAFEPATWIHYRNKDSSFSNAFNLNPLTHFSILTGPFFDEARSRAIKSLYSTIHRAHHQLQGGVVLGELGKTARMLAKTAGGLKQGVFNYLGKAVGIRRGRGSNASKQKAIAGSYLEATFGWAPLIHDAKDLAKTIGRLCHESDRVRFRAHGMNAGQAAQSAGAVSFASLYVNYVVVDEAVVEVLYRGFLQGPKYEAGSPPAERIVSMSGFDLRSFIPTVWELVPYSFLVDYFTNVGDVLQALSVDTSGVHGLWKTETWQSERKINLAPDFKRSRAQLLIQYGGAGEKVKIDSITGKDGGFTVKLRNVSRAASGMPLMLPRFTLGDISWRQFANMGALLVR